MVVKEKRGRRRYIAFSVPSRFTKQDLIHSFKAPAVAPYVVKCGHGFAVIRCAPKETDETIEMMRAVCSSSVSLMTSGTIKALRKKVPDLELLFSDVEAKT